MRNKSYVAIIILGIITLAFGIFGLINSVLKNDWFLIAYDSIWIFLGVGIITLKFWARIVILTLSWLILIIAPLLFILMIVPAILTHKPLASMVFHFLHQSIIFLFYSIIAVLLLSRPSIKAQFKKSFSPSKSKSLS